MVANNYELDYHLEKHGHLYDDEEYYLARSKIARHDYFDTYIEKSTKILEYGVGFGQNIFCFPSAVGYDVSKFALDFCEEKGIKIVKEVDDLKNNYFDIILSCEVLEHLENPFEELKIIHSKLSDEGELILVLPIDKWNKPNLNDKNQHLYNWNFNTITNLLGRAGFKPIDYKILRRTGFRKLLPFNKISFELYLFLTKLLAIVTGSKHMKIVAVKK